VRSERGRSRRLSERRGGKEAPSGFCAACHVGIKGSDLTAESANLEVLELLKHVELLCGLWLCLISIYSEQTCPQ